MEEPIMCQKLTRFLNKFYKYIKLAKNCLKNNDDKLENRYAQNTHLFSKYESKASCRDFNQLINL